MEERKASEELKTLIAYLIKHNESHTKELEELSVALKDEGNKEAYEAVLKAIESYKKGNKELASSLEKISK